MLERLRRLFRHSPEVKPTSRPPVTLVSTGCPYCGLFLSPPPDRQGECPECGKTIRTWLDLETGEKHLLTQTQHARLRRLRKAERRSGSPNPMPRQDWTREQQLAVLYLKLTCKDWGHPKIAVLSKAIGRKQGALKAIAGKFDFLDPEIDGGIPNPAQLTRDIWAEYENDPERVLSEAYLAYIRLVAGADDGHSTVSISHRAE